MLCGGGGGVNILLVYMWVFSSVYHLIIIIYLFVINHNFSKVLISILSNFVFHISFSNGVIILCISVILFLTSNIINTCRLCMVIFITYYTISTPSICIDAYFQDIQDHHVRIAGKHFLQCIVFNYWQIWLLGS